MDVQDRQIIIHSPRRPRSGWDRAFKQMARLGDDSPLDVQPVATRWDDEEWQWK